ALVKTAFNYGEVNKVLLLTSANSINIARLIPQTYYYFWVYQQLNSHRVSEVVFTVLCGDFGNFRAGLLAYDMRLPVTHVVAGTNVNDTVPRFLQSGSYDSKPSVQTLANAMDVGNPSNWVRIQDLFQNNLDELRGVISSYTYDDDQTVKAMEELYTN